MKTDYSKQLHQMMVNFAHRYGENVYKVYTSLIDYLCGYLDMNGTPVHGWSFTKEQNEQFRLMAQEALRAVAAGMEERGWYDIFGDIFMTHLADKDRRGQCFTPDEMAQVCSRFMLEHGEPGEPQMPCGVFGPRHVLSEPSCGSGRLILSAYSLFLKKYDVWPYAVCEDIDTTCCKQTALNLCLHGYYGEVVCHDTIKDPDKLFFGYIVNEGLYPFHTGLPTLRLSCDPKEFVCTRCWQQMHEAHKDDHPQPPESKKNGEVVQLSLF